MIITLWCGLFLPLLGFFTLLFLSNTLPRKYIEYIGCATVFFSFLCFSGLVYNYSDAVFAQDITLYSWIPIKGINANFALHVDHLALLMTLIITGVGFLIHVYSIGYMDHDKDIARYFAIMNFFIFSMLLLVLASHLLVLFIGWEGVGLASYLLIGYWYEKPSAAQAATKAFVVNRIGDLGLLLGLLLTFQLFGTGNIAEISRRVGTEFTVGAPILTLLTLLYFWGATGKSAQLPLHVWLPDAMEGPTPVSALIHAATMVTAGVYLVVRMHPVFAMAPDTLQIIGYVGGATALLAALCATSQTDLKRVLAYSTISQLGLMFLACGVGAYFAAMFHLTTHAFVKALLFMSAGNVVHMMHGTTEMDKMGGLYKSLPKTHIIFLIGVLSMSGIPPLAIFFSKDLILEEEFLGGCRTLYITGLFISVLTAFYLTRAYLLTFRGISHAKEIIKEAPSIMIAPVAILAILSVAGGLLGFALDRPPLLMAYLEQDSMAFESQELIHGFHLTAETWVSIVAAFSGVALSLYLYTHLKKPILFFLNSFYINQLYSKVIVRPLKAMSIAVCYFFEPVLFDGSIQISADTAYKAAGVLQRVQSGQIRSYISWIVLGSVVLIIYFISGSF